MSGRAPDSLLLDKFNATRFIILPTSKGRELVNALLLKSRNTGEEERLKNSVGMEPLRLLFERLKYKRF